MKMQRVGDHISAVPKESIQKTQPIGDPWAAIKSAVP
jgi:hypothetical protein